ncbi:uncharacterized protein HMPREF1541_08825 [Cyphellophora europaea CBS 101466]|uniref:FAD-binding domain-containing protein n=1 Tax=Cyphellophora europaea (strain CBS 101466) TaxID=1220924 RepID=W2RJ75_CYPE1|nr:uncharacterized protein HMPREF1541_08825 [Cyphellophora europaea CBS 101466]ETN36547.1 hypothetical protein HMPREF1541_08825 [Cyphellophora europaea CBS 101466]
MSKSQILIIGGGLAGLALGQSLLTQHIPFHIYERDTSSSFRSQGYRIRISEDGASALKSLLPAQLYEQFDRTSAPVIKNGCQIDASTAESSPGSMPAQPGQAWNVDRATIRNVLLQGLDEHMTFGKHFSHYTLRDDDVTAHFGDGTDATGTLLVAADGVRSPVRRQFLPNYTVLDTTGRAIFGKTLLASLPTSVPQQVLNHGISVISDPAQPEVKLFCDTMRFNHSLLSTSTAPPPVSLPDDYLYWVLLLQTTSTTMPDPEFLSLKSAGAAALATKLTTNWHPTIRAITEHQLADAAAPLSFLMARPPIAAWDTNARVTLVGDAAHPMPPVGGVGANAAWQDAAELATLIREGGGEVTVEALATFEDGARSRSNAWAERARGGMAKLLGVVPVEEMREVEC